MAGAVRALCAALAAAVLVPVPASAQQVATAFSRGEIVPPATIVDDADLDFGVIAARPTSGTVVLTPSATATCTTTGGLVHTGACKAAEFSGVAFYQADLKVMRPQGNSITLTGPSGATMVVDNFTYGSSGTTVDLGANGANHHFGINAPDGSYTFYVGATLHIGANQLEGVYTGTFDIKISYN